MHLLKSYLISTIVLKFCSEDCEWIWVWTEIMKVLETLSCENQVKELRLEEKTQAVCPDGSPSHSELVVVGSGGGSLCERGMCQQGWYSCQLRRPKTWVWVIILLLIYLSTIFQFREYLTQCLDSILPTPGYMEYYIITWIHDFILNRIQTCSVV